MIHFPILLKRAMAALMLGSLLFLAACHSNNIKGDAVSTASMQGQFDTTIKAGKSGQFLVDGALLSAIDTGSHFAYLKDQGKLPKTVLIVPSDDSKVRKQHLQYLARMQLDYGFTVYYDDDGTLKKINPVDVKARTLEDYHAPAQMNDELKGKDASSSPYDPSNQQ